MELSATIDTAIDFYIYGLCAVQIEPTLEARNSIVHRRPSVSCRTQIPNSLTRLNSDLTYLSQSWGKSDSRLITCYLIWPKVVELLRGMDAFECSWHVGSFPVTLQIPKCKILTLILTFSLQTNRWLNFDIGSRYSVGSTRLKRRSAWLNSTRLISLIFTADSTMTRLIWVRLESNLTHDSWVEHNHTDRPHGHNRPHGTGSFFLLGFVLFKNRNYVDP